MSVSTRRRTPALARTFRSLKTHRNYRLWFIGQVVSISGMFVQSVAQSWFILALTHSAVALGVLAVCQFGPYFALGLFGGAVVDRLNVRHTIMGTQAAMMLTSGLLAVLVLTGLHQVWPVMLLATIDGLVAVLDNPSRQAFTMQMVGRRELPNAVALNSSLFNSSRVLGPAIGGLLIATVGVGICFAINSMSFLAVLAALWYMRPSELLLPDANVRPRRNLLHESAEGMRFAWRSSAIRLPLVMMTVISAIAINFNIWLPILAQQTLHSNALVFGWLSAAFGAGALTGALIAATLGRASRRLLLIGAIAFSLSELVLAPLHSLWPCLVVLYCSGVAFTTYSAMTNSTIQLAVPDALRGRVMGLYGYAFMGTAPLGGLLAAWLAQVGGTELAFGVAGGVALMTALVGVLVVTTTARHRGSARITVAGPEVSMVRE